MRLAVARIGRPHGIKGEVTIETLTALPQERFFPGARLECDSTVHPLLEVTSVRQHQGRWMLTFFEVTDRNEAERLRDSRLYSEVDLDEEDEESGYHIEQLRGMKVLSLDRQEIGVVSGVLNLPGQDLLQVTTDSGEKLIPMVHEFIDDVDLATGEITVDLPEGLLD